MGVVSSIASHPQRQRIIDALVAEQPYRIIQSWATPSVSTGALSRFKRQAIRELSGAVRSSVERQTGAAVTERIYDTDGRIAPTGPALSGAMTAIASPFRHRLEQLWGVTERSIQRAETAVRVTFDKDAGELVCSGADVAAIAPLIAQGHRNAELLARATGELSDQQSNSPVVNLAVCLNVPRD
jgi:hypothetical protein